MSNGDQQEDKGPASCQLKFAIYHRVASLPS